MVGEVWRSTSLQKDASKYAEITSCKYDPKRATSNCVIQLIPGLPWLCLEVLHSAFHAILSEGCCFGAGESRAIVQVQAWMERCHQSIDKSS